MSLFFYFGAAKWLKTGRFAFGTLFAVILDSSC